MITTANDARATGDGGAARKMRADAYNVSSDDTLLLELGPELGERFRTRPIEQMGELPAADAAPWIGFIDGHRTDARHWVLHIEKHLPNAALIVITAPADLASWQALVFRGTVCAALSDQQIGTAALNDALDRAAERLRAMAAQHAIHADVRPAPAGAPGGWGEMPGMRPVWLWPAIAAAAVVAGIALWRGFASDRHSAPSSAATMATGAPRAPGAIVAPTIAKPAAAIEPVPQRPVLELLSSARSAFRDPERQLPRADARTRGDSALELYAQVLAQEPANGEARDGLRRLYSVGRSRLQSDLAANHMDDAQRLLAIFRAASSDAAALKGMEADVAAAQPRWLAAQARRALAANDLAAAEQDYAQLQALGAERATLQELRRTLDARQADAQLQAMAEDVRAAISAGNLLEPAATSARAHLLAMRQANRSHPLTLTAQHDLQEALLARARDAQTGAQPEATQRWLTAAAELGASNEVSEFRRQLQAEQERAAPRAASATQAAPTAAAVANTPPAAAPATATPTATTAAQQFLSARPLQPLKVVYPDSAARAGRQGYVIVEFTMGRDGRATDAQVIESSPVGVFDRAALDAVGRGRYDARALDDPAAPRRARIRLTFRPS